MPGSSGENSASFILKEMVTGWGNDPLKKSVTTCGPRPQLVEQRVCQLLVSAGWRRGKGTWAVRRQEVYLLRKSAGDCTFLFTAARWAGPLLQRPSGPLPGARPPRFSPEPHLLFLPPESGVSAAAHRLHAGLDGCARGATQHH